MRNPNFFLKVAEYIYPTDVTPEYSTILVPNVDNTRTDYLVNAISKQGKVSNYNVRYFDITLILF